MKGPISSEGKENGKGNKIRENVKSSKNTYFWHHLEWELIKFESNWVWYGLQLAPQLALQLVLQLGSVGSQYTERTASVLAPCWRTYRIRDLSCLSSPDQLQL